MKTPELAAKLAAEAIERDPWAAQVSQLSLPAGGAGGAQCPEGAERQRGLSASALDAAAPQFQWRAAKPAQALSDLTGTTVELTIVEDDTPRCVRRWNGVRPFMKRNSRKRVSQLLRIITFRRCVDSSTPSWMKRVSAPFDRKPGLRL